MNLNDLRNKYTVSQPKAVTTKRELTWRHKDTKAVTVQLPLGSKVNVYFVKEQPSTLLVEVSTGEVKSTSMNRCNDNFTGFMKMPSIKTLEKWSNDGICKTVEGERIEPDGCGSSGAPSWLLAVGVI